MANATSFGLLETAYPLIGRFLAPGRQLDVRLQEETESIAAKRASNESPSAMKD